MGTNIPLILFKNDGGGGSDLALKQDIHQLSHGLPEILALRPVTWRWKDKTLSPKRQYGFIAQEVEALLPALVEEGTWYDGTRRKFLTATGLIPYLVSAIQKQQQQIDQLKAAGSLKDRHHS